MTISLKDLKIKYINKTLFCAYLSFNGEFLTSETYIDEFLSWSDRIAHKDMRSAIKYLKKGRKLKRIYIKEFKKFHNESYYFIV